MMLIKRHASKRIACEAALAYELLSDYAAYEQWMPGVKSSKVLAQETNFAIAELEFIAHPGVKMTVECLHAPRQTVIARTLTGNKPAFKLAWDIAPTESGEAQVTVKMEGHLRTLFRMGWSSIFADPQKGLECLVDLVATYGDSPASDKIIEINETDEGLFCSYRGTKYQLKPLS